MAVMQLKKLGRITMPYDMVQDIARKRSYIDVNELFCASYIHIGPYFLLQLAKTLCD